MPALPASICIALANPAAPYDGDPPALRVATPVLPAAAASAAGFAPAGWTVERSVAGDLNKDGRGDLVVVLKGVDPHCVVPTEGAAGSIDTNPRVLLVAFARVGGRVRSGGGFALQLANAAVIPRVDDPYMDDPFDEDGLQVRGGVIRLGLNFWRSMGGWASFTSTLSFRWDGTRFALIGFDRESVQRNSGATESLSINYATGRARVATGSIEDDVDTKVRWRRVRVPAGASLETMADGLAFEGVPAG